MKKYLCLIYFLFSVFSYGEILYNYKNIKLDVREENGKVLAYDINNKNKLFTGTVDIDGINFFGKLFFKNGILKRKNIQDKSETPYPYEKIIEYYDNRKMKHKTFIRRSRGYKIESFFYPNGNLKEITSYTYNDLEDSWKKRSIKSFYENGNYKSLTIYENNCTEDYTFDKMEKLIKKSITKNGKTKTEIFDNKYFYKDKKLKLKVLTKDNACYIVNDDDTLFTGTITTKEFDPDSSVPKIIEASYKDGLKDGITTVYKRDGKLVLPEVYQYEKGKINGSVKYYIKQTIDKLSQEKIYENGEIVKYIIYHDNGDALRDNEDIFSVVSYKDNMKSGKKIIYSSHTLRKNYIFTDGNKGAFIYNPKLISGVEEYRYGEAHGNNIFYDTDGRLKYHTVYINDIETENTDSSIFVNFLGTEDNFNFEELIKLEKNIKEKLYSKFSNKHSYSIINSAGDLFLVKLKTNNEKKLKKEKYPLDYYFNELSEKEKYGNIPSVTVHFSVLDKENSEREKFKKDFLDIISRIDIEKYIDIEFKVTRCDKNHKPLDTWIYRNNVTVNNEGIFLAFDEKGKWQEEIPTKNEYLHGIGIYKTNNLKKEVIYDYGIKKQERDI